MSTVQGATQKPARLHRRPAAQSRSQVQGPPAGASVGRQASVRHACPKAHGPHIFCCETRQVQSKPVSQWNDCPSGQSASSSQGTAQRPLRVAVLLSAWDLVEAMSRTETPERFLERRLPLLHQFLRANDLGLTARIYGVSAQGGDLKTQHDELAAKVNPSERVRVVGPEASVHDLAAPLRFLVR